MDDYFPPPGGVRTLVVEFPPESDSNNDAAAPEEQLAEFERHFTGNYAAIDFDRPGMHRSATVDFGLVLDGEIVLALDDGETTLRAGDLVVQNGTMHAWHNRSGRSARMMFVMVGAHLEA